MDIDGHKVMIHEGEGVPAPKPKPTPKPSGGRTSGGGSSSSSDTGGSSYVSPPPPPNPRENYIKKAFLSIGIDTSSRYTLVKTMIEHRDTVKSIITCELSKSCVLNDVTTKKSSTDIEAICNNFASRCVTPFGSVNENKLRSIDDTIKGVQEINKILEQNKKQEEAKQQNQNNTKKQQSSNNASSGSVSYTSINFDFSGLDVGVQYKMGSLQFESIWSTVENVLGRKLIRPSLDNPNKPHEYQCPTLVDAIIRSINNVTAAGDGKQQATNLYNNNSGKFELLSTANNTLNTNSIINEGAVISLHYSESYANYLIDNGFVVGMTTADLVKYGHVTVNISSVPGNTITTIEGNCNGAGSVMIRNQSVSDLLDLVFSSGTYTQVDIANPIFR